MANENYNVEIINPLTDENKQKKLDEISPQFCNYKNNIKA